MIRFILGGLFVLFLFSHQDEVKRFVIDTGLRDQVVSYLQGLK